MDDLSTSVIPAGVIRRLLLACLGWRWDGSGYRCGGQYVSEEKLDSMSDERWGDFIACFVVSAN
jgi:hypothetical protein